MLITVIVFLIVLSILVLVHELGHFIAAKKFGILVEEFGFGLPPRLFGKKIGETIYSINWLPIGGFVKLYGEEGEGDKSLKVKAETLKTGSKLNRAFYTRPIWQRAVVLTAGVAMNFLFAVAIISFLFTQGVMVPTNRVHIEKIIANSPAEVVGLREKDIIKKFRIHPPVDGSEFKIQEIEIKNGEQLIQTTKEHLGEEVTLVIDRDGEEMMVSVVPRKDYPKDEGPMGIVISNFEEKKYSLAQAPFLGTKESLILSLELAKGIAKTVWKLISFQPVAKDVAGPIGIAQLTGEAIKFGERAILELMGLLSLNLAIVNILPFPALDGGRLLFVVIEGITGRRIRTNWERYIHQIGMIILLTLMVLVTVNDLIRILSK